MNFYRRLRLCCYIFCYSSLGAISSVDLEQITALFRTPIVISANILSATKGKKSKRQNIMILAADVIRLSNEILSVYNNHCLLDCFEYDFCWGAYDAVNLVSKLKNIFKGDSIDKLPPAEIQKLHGMVLALHELILPIIEGGAACLKLTACDNTIEDKLFKNQCMAICSLSRLVDNLITAKPKSTEWYAYAILLAANIVFAVGMDLIVADAPVDEYVSPDLSDKAVKEEKTFFTEQDCLHCAETFKQGDKVRRFACGHVAYHAGKCFEHFDTSQSDASKKCPDCRAQRVEAKETDIIFTQDALNGLQGK